MKLVFGIFTAAVVVCGVNGFGGLNKPPHHQLLQKPQAQQQRPLPRYYAEQNPHIIASPRPLTPHNQHHHHQQHSNNHVASYRTLNPGPNNKHHPTFMNHRSARSEEPHHHPHHATNVHPPQLLASASNTPVLVLKKDHARPILSSAVVAAAIAEKRQQQAQAEKPQQEKQQQIPTVIMERPGNQDQEKKEIPQQQEKQEQQKQEESIEIPPSLEHDSMSAEETPQERVNSAERRMFFNSMHENVQEAQQVSGPQGPSRPHHQKQPQHASASSIQSTRANPRPINPVHHPEMEEHDGPIERIVRSNSNNPYSGGNLAFEYPPPQGNYISQGPTRVPVKYQQGVIGIKPAHHGGGGQGQQQGGKHQQQQQRPYRQRIQQQQQQGGAGSEEPLNSEELEEEEEAQPDRLQELLGTSKFSCDGKKDGYYADDSLNCEVFHYCQANSKHSWICPASFLFHQIHLICVPPSSDNICKQSSSLATVVNDHLYRPINEKEAFGTNISLKYADRYFPEGYSNGAGDILLPYHDEEEEDEDAPRRPQNHQQQQQHHYNPFAQQQAPRTRPNPIPQQQQHHQQPYNPYAQRPSSSPPYVSQGGFVPSPQLHAQQQPQRHQQSQQQQRHHQQPYAQQRSGSSVHPQQIKPNSKPPHPHNHHHHHSKSSSNPGVFFTPESINIPLQQRRPIPNPHPNHHPQMFRPSPQVHSSSKSGAKEATTNNRRKYEEDEEYEY